MHGRTAPARLGLRFKHPTTPVSVQAQTAPYPIPVLAEPPLVLDAFVRLRETYDCANLTNEQVHNPTSKTLNGYVAQFFSDDAGTP